MGRPVTQPPAAAEAPAFRDRHAGCPAGPDGYREEGFFTLQVAGRTYRLPRHCPHRAGRLQFGHVNAQRKTISCPLHHSVFSLETGEQLSGPPCGRLAVEEITGRPAAGNGSKDSE